MENKISLKLRKEIRCFLAFCGIAALMAVGIIVFLIFKGRDLNLVVKVSWITLPFYFSLIFIAGFGYWRLNKKIDREKSKL